MKTVWGVLGLVVGLGFASEARAEIDPNCAGKAPSPYNEIVQTDFLLNYIALSASLSAIHAPIPHEAGHGSLGIDLSIIPPLGCSRRFALGASKTEATNKSPVVPRLRASFAFPVSWFNGNLVPYAGIAFVPPVPVAGTRSVIVSGEVGAGYAFDDFQLGLRFHTTLMKTVADAATGFDAGDPVVDDVYIASTLGADLSAGYAFGTAVTPYVGVGITDVSTLFWIGDDGVMSNNLHPYMGPTFAVGADGLVGKRFRWGAEFYGAPGGYSKPAPEFPDQPGFGTYGHLYTLRIRLGLEL